MKKLLKIALVLIIPIFNSCNSDSPVKEIVENGQWNETISSDIIFGNNKDIYNKNGNNNLIDHSLILENNTIYEYLDGDLIAEIPVKIDDKSIIIYHPINENQILSVLKINEDGSMTNAQGLTFLASDGEIKKSKQSIKSKVQAKGPWCEAICRATHRSLGVPRWLDSICCFWYNGEL